MASYSKLKKLHEKKGEIEFEGEIPKEIIVEHTETALLHAAEHFQMQGFRKGKVPLNLVREHANQFDLLESAADTALRTAMQEIVADEHLDVWGMPQIAITKMAPGNPVSFKIRYPLFSEITLPDYKKIGQTITARKDDNVASDEEVQSAIERLRVMLARDVGQSATDPLPELNDAFAQKLGPFNDMDALRTDVKKQLSLEKQIAARDAKRNEIIREIVTQSKITIPELLIDQELVGFVEGREAELKKAGLSLDEYLKETKKSRETLDKEDRAIIEERLKMSAIVGEIRKKENIVPAEDEVRANMDRLRTRQGNRNEESLRRTAEAIIIQEKMFDMLEGIDYGKASA